MIHNFISFSSDGALVTPPGNAPMGLDTLPDQGFQVDNPESPDFSFVANIAAEMFNRASADVFIYLRTKNEDIVNTHDEDPDPTYSVKQPGKAYFQPQPMEFVLKQFGVELDNKMEIVFLRSAILSQFGERMLKPGDVIEAPYRSLSENRPTRYRVVNSQEFGNYRYQWIYIKTNTELLTADITVIPPDQEKMAVNDYPHDL
jgi:hypothetical protein